MKMANVLLAVDARKTGPWSCGTWCRWPGLPHPVGSEVHERPKKRLRVGNRDLKVRVVDEVVA